MVLAKYTHVIGSKVLISKFSQIGTGSVILPGVIINEGVAIGALSLVRTSLDAWCIYAGNPLKLIKIRQKGLIELSRDFETILL